MRLLAALAGMVLSLVFFTTRTGSQKPKIFGIWIGIDRNSLNFGKWKNKPNTPTPEFTAWGAEQSCEQGRLVELPTPGACEPINPVQFVGGLFEPDPDGGNQIVLLNEWVAVPRRIYTDGRKHPPPAEDAADVGRPLDRPLGRRHARGRHGRG